MGIRKQLSKTREEAVAVAIDKDRGSQHAFKWAVDRLVKPCQALTLLHVKQTAAPAVPNQSTYVHQRASLHLFCIHASTIIMSCFNFRCFMVQPGAWFLALK